MKKNEIVNEEPKVDLSAIEEDNLDLNILEQRQELIRRRLDVMAEDHKKEPFDICVLMAGVKSKTGIKLSTVVVATDADMAHMFDQLAENPGAKSAMKMVLLHDFAEHLKSKSGLIVPRP